MLKEDPIVGEVRRHGRQSEDEAQGDVHQFFEKLRQAERQNPDRLVRLARTKQP